MSNEHSSDAKAAAVALVQGTTTNSTRALSHAQLAPIIKAVAEDIEVRVTKSVEDEARLAKVEAQTHVLAEAVVAMTETAASLAPAVKAVKDEM